MRPAEQRDNRITGAFDEHFDAVFRYCLRRLPREDANDAVARVFAIAWRKVDDMPDREGVLPWLYRIASFEVSTIRRSGRRLGNLRTRLSGVADPPVPQPDTVVLRRAEHETVLAALARLSDRDREIILLRSYEDLSTNELAAVLGLSPDAARQRLSRALRRLRKVAGIDELTAQYRAEGGGES